MSAKENREVLESWKEISSYLNRDVKTCRRWELKLDLPIRRLNGSTRARVFAYKEDLDSWLKEKLDNREITTTKYLRIVKKKPKILWIAISFILAIVIVGVLAMRFLPRIDFITHPSAKTHLAVLPIKNFTADNSLLFLPVALNTLIISDLNQSKFMSVVATERMNRILEDMNLMQKDSYTTTELKKISSREKITHFLNVSVTKFGEKIRLDLSVLDAGDWKTTWSDNIEGTIDDMFTMADALTVKLKPELNLTNKQIADDFDEKIENVTTPNERALQFYIEARRAMNDTEWNLATEYFERATTLDPDFAMAYRYQSGVYNHLALATGENEYWEKMHAYETKAKDAAHRRPPSERERMIIEGLGIPPQQSFEAFKKLLELYPDDDYGNYRLGVNYAQGENYDLAERHLQHILPYTENSFTYLWLADIYLDQERYQEAENLIELGLVRFPDNCLFFQRMAKLHVLQQEFDKALLWCDMGFGIEPIQFRNTLINGDVLLFKEDFLAAEEEYRLCLNSKNSQTRIQAAVSLIHLFKTQGRFNHAKKEAEEATQSLIKNIDWDFDQINTELALSTAREGNFEEAFKLAEEVLDQATRFKLLAELSIKIGMWAEGVIDLIEQAVQEKNSSEWGLFLSQNDMQPPFSQNMMRKLFGLKARIVLEKGEYGQAIAHVEQSKSLFPGSNLIPADLIEVSGLASFQSGDLESARDQFEQITRMTYGRKKYGVIYAKSFYMLGQICEQLGKKREARDYYERFLDLWKVADSGIPEIENARNRLALLQ